MGAPTAFAGVVCLLIASAVAYGAQDGSAPDVTEGRLEAVAADGSPSGSCPLEHTDVRADVSGFVSRVTVTQRFSNPFTKPIEAVYLFPLPDSAAVDGMTMRIGDRVIRSIVKTREEARATYERARTEGKTASLLEQQRPNVFTQSVANILPGDRIEVEITYVDTLAYANGGYEFVFPMVVGERYTPSSMSGEAAASLQAPSAVRHRAGHDISLELHIDAGVPIVSLASKMHAIDVERPSDHEAVVRLEDGEVPNRDFVLDYAVAGEKIEDAILTHHDDRGGFVTLVLQPPDRVAQSDVSPKEIVFVLDTSGSMAGYPIEKAKECIRLALDNLYPDDTFNLITFAGHTEVLFPHPVSATPANLKEARAFLDIQSGRDGTEMMTAIRAALDPSDAQDHIRVVCFMTDGYVGNDLEIIGEVRSHPNARVFSFGIGDAVNRFLLDGIATEGRGEAEYVTTSDDGSAAARHFFERVRNPILTDVSIDWGSLGVTDVTPARIPDLFDAKPVVVTGRYTSAGSGVVRLTGRSDGREVTREINVTLPDDEPRNEAIATTWARAKIGDLMRDDYHGLQVNEPKAEVRAGIEELGLAYHLATQFTSFVAVEERARAADGDPETVLVPLVPPEGTQSASESVTVTGGYSASYGASNVLVTSNQVQNLVIVGRSLALLSPGTLSSCATSTSIRQEPGGQAFSTSEAPEVIGVPPDAVQEVDDHRSDMSSLGASPRDAVDVLTKSGGSEFHGTVYETNRTSATASQPFAEKAVVASAIPEGVFTRNQFGFAIGGPVVRDRVFFFGATDWLRVRSTRNAAFLVPTPELLARSAPATQAFFAAAETRPGIDGRSVRVGDVPFASPALAALGSNFPAFTQRYVALCGDTGAGVAQNTAQGTARFDIKLTERTNVSMRYGFDRSTLFPGATSASPYAGFDTGGGITNDRVEGTLTQVVSPTLVADLSFAFDRRRLDLPLATESLGTTLFLSPRPFATIGDGTAAIAFPGYLPLTPGDGLPSSGPRFDESFSAAISYLHSEHTIKAGTTWSRVFDDRSLGGMRQSVDALGRSGPSALENFLLGQPLEHYAAVDTDQPRDRAVRFDEIGFFVSDSWRIRPRVTLTAALRYDVFGAPRETASGGLGNFIPGSGTTAAERIASGAIVSIGGESLYRLDRDNWSPRVGVSWDVFDNDRTTIRGGYATTHERVAGRAASSVYTNATAFRVLHTFSTDLGSEGALPFIRAVDPDLRAPTVHLWNAAVVEEIDGLLTTVEYSGSKGVGLASLDDVNRPYFGAVYLGIASTRENPLARLNPNAANILQLRNSGSSTTNALSLGVQTREAVGGVSFAAWYRWAHQIDDVGLDDGPFGFSAGHLDPFDPRLDRGNADVDVRHRFETSGVWEPSLGGDDGSWRKRWLGGWHLGWMFTARTGLPFTVYDCTHALSTCSRLVASGALDGQGAAAVSSLGSDLATGNRYRLFDLSAIGVRGAYVNALSGTSDVGPYPSGMTARNFFRAPGSFDVDGSIAKTIHITERVGLELRAEALNVLNHPTLTVSRSEADASSSPYVPAFYDGRRQVQFGARLTF